MELRDVQREDLPVLFEHQRDPVAARMAAFASREWPAFLVHWRDRVLGDPEVLKLAVVVDGEVVGSVVSFLLHDRRTIGYWIGRSSWGRGVATAALQHFLADHEPRRPLFADVAVHNLGSRRVLEKHGFVVIDRVTGPDGIEDLVFRLG